MTDMNDYEAVLLDIEGTTTPVRFVYEVLFPYAQRELKNYLEKHWSDPNVQEDISQLMEHYATQPRDEKGRPESLPEDQSNVEAFRSEVIERINMSMDGDEKITALKSLQGRIWKNGYQQGELEAPLFDDVPGALQAWQERDVPVYIYSSGSVEAQKLLFSFTEHGDLREYLSGYFDTTTGSKKEASSYEAIAAEVGMPASEILFVTDNLQEAEAAREAGMTVAVSVRPGNAELPEHDFDEIESFDALL